MRMSYNEKLVQLKSTIQQLHNDSLSVDELTEQLNGAFDLIRDLRQTLTATRLKVDEIVQANEDSHDEGDSFEE